MGKIMTDMSDNAKKKAAGKRLRKNKFDVGQKVLKIPIK